ncbi:MAG TPA: YbbR-like domain-containing protein [Bacteroidales bacterium]|nr:YbbR-like domain-containing protein [Bacteroidales bacterium]HPS26023.1 YbbR-like domain-containing protein [Bacteroidales bacterium]
MTSGSYDTSLDEQQDNQKRSKRKLNIFIICFIIASISWLMIKLSGTYSHNVVVSVTYKGIKNNRIMLPSSDTLLIANIQSSGYNIIYNRLLNENYLFQLDLSQYPARRNGDIFEITIETASLTYRLGNYFKTGEKVVSIYPANLRVQLERAHSKKVPVQANVDITFKNQYAVYKHIYLEPDSVYVTGSKAVIDKISYVETEKSEQKGLSKNTFLELSLNNPLNKYVLRYSADKVKMYIPVAEYTEEFVDIPLTFESVPDGYQLIGYPDKIRCFFNVSIPDYDKISPEAFKAGINEKNLFHSKHNSAKVVLKKVPPYAKVQRIEPESIEYLIRKK